MYFLQHFSLIDIVDRATARSRAAGGGWFRCVGCYNYEARRTALGRGAHARYHHTHPAAPQITRLYPRLILVSVTKYHRNNANNVHSSKQIVSILFQRFIT